MKLWSAKTFFLVAAGAAALLLFSFLQEINRRWHYQQEVHRLTAEVEQLEQETIVLARLNQYFTTAEYQERQAREKLNYRAPGEKVVLIPHNAKNTIATQPKTQQRAAALSIPEQWWHVFFVDESGLYES